MSYGGFPYGGAAYAGSEAGGNPEADTETTLAVEWSPTTGPLEEPVWVDITGDVRFWDTDRGRGRELERFQPGRATIVLANRERQYDSLVNVNVKPMKRIRIRETFNGVTYPVFDGFVDRWVLDYPNVGKDATATVTATDAFKVFARTDMPRSVYTQEVETSAPVAWWRLDEDVARLNDGFALNSGTGGPSYDATFVGSPRVKADVLITNDPGSSVGIASAFAAQSTPLQGATIDNSVLNLLGMTTFTIEAWVRLTAGGSNRGWVGIVSQPSDANDHMAFGFFDPGGVGTGMSYEFQIVNSAFTLAYGVKSPNLTAVPGDIVHLLGVVETGGQMAIWVNGVRYTALGTGATATSLSGITRPAGGDFSIGHENNTAPDPFFNWHGEISEVAIYNRQLTDAEIAAHFAAGTHPWQGDDADGRITRVLDLSDWSAAQRELDDGDTTFQSAELDQTALEHLAKCAETEFGLLFITRDGKVRFISKASQFARTPLPLEFGDESPEIGYRAFTPDDGDEVIRNRATISRLNGVAKSEEDATSLDEFGRFQYTLEGLLHDSDSYSLAYAGFIVTEYGEQKRRITSLTVGPPIAGEEDTVYPAMLSPELGDAFTVVSRPIGGGAPFTQVCVVEGIQASGAPGGVRTTTFTLSPELTESF
jgi:hypothetical protein